MQRRPVALPEHRRPRPFQVKILRRLYVGRFLPNRAVGGDGAAGDAPARQRIRHNEAETGATVRVGFQRRQPQRRVHVVAARAFAQFQRPLAVAVARIRPIRRHGDIVCIKIQAR